MLCATLLSGSALANTLDEYKHLVRGRRRLDVETCSFASPGTRDSANCIGTYDDFVTPGDASSDTPTTLSFSPLERLCCFDQAAGLNNAGADQQLCDGVQLGFAFSSSECTDIATEDTACAAIDPAAGDELYQPGYSYDDTCSDYADACRDSLTCATGYSGQADLACPGAGVGDFFALKGCARADLGTVGTDSVADTYIAIPGAYPADSNSVNVKSSLAQCQSTCSSTGCGAVVASTGSCDHLSNQFDSCASVENCGVVASFDGDFVPSSAHDLYVSPGRGFVAPGEHYFTACEDDSGGNTGANNNPGCATTDWTNWGEFGSLDFYGDRFKCWKNHGGGANTVSDAQLSTYQTSALVVGEAGDTTNADGVPHPNIGIAQSAWQFENLNTGEVLISGEGASTEDGYGFVVCDGAGTGVGCTLELCAMMCEAYNAWAGFSALDDGGELQLDRCIGFVFADGVVGVGRKNAYKTTAGLNLDDSTRGLCAFVSGRYGRGGQLANDRRWNPTKDSAGALFEMGDWPAGSAADTSLITDLIGGGHCDVVSSARCDWCSSCETGYVLNDNLCIISGSCPAGKYETSTTCEYCIDHCVLCTDGTTCAADSCDTGFALNVDSTACEQIGCTANFSTSLAGYVSGSTDGCVDGVNIPPGGACEVACPEGEFGDGGDPVATCASVGQPMALAVSGALVCTPCTEANCASCPGDVCDNCVTGFELSGSSCSAVTCPNPDDTADVNDAEDPCTICPVGSHGSTVTWNDASDVWDTSSCVACTGNCADCTTGVDENDCAGSSDGDRSDDCESGYSIFQNGGGTFYCVETPQCGVGQSGAVTAVDLTEANGYDFSACADVQAQCEDAVDDTYPNCVDCADGYRGSVAWNTDTETWDNSQCTLEICPDTSETGPACTNCALGQTGSPVWDDVAQRWTGCVDPVFGFSASISSDSFKIDVLSSELLHIANGQYDAVRDKWVCDEGFAGVNCQLRLCPESSSFVSHVDPYTPGSSDGTSWSTDVGTSSTATFSNQHAYRECSGRGTCDYETGQCQCFPGYTGVGCQRTSCPNGCSGHGRCMDDDVTNYHAAVGSALPSDMADINTWGNLWAHGKFQSCRCDGGWGGNDCSLRLCPHGDDPETVCDEDLGNDIQEITCTNVPVDVETYFYLRFTDQIGHRYTTRAIVAPAHDDSTTDEGRLANAQAVSTSIQTALEALPNFAVPQVEVNRNENTFDYQGPSASPTQINTVTYEVTFTHARTSGELPLMEAFDTPACEAGAQPKIERAAAAPSFGCAVTRKAATEGVNYRENLECSNRGLCNRKTAECSCFDGYTGLACDVVAQTY